MLDSISEQLLACQTALNQYIDEKRSTFPRLYFLSDDDLLELLGQARAGADGREAVMQTHLKKLFPGATGVALGPGGMSITALCSHHGETFQLEHPVDIDCAVEVWLKNLETEMRTTLKNMTLKCVLTNSLQNQDPFSLPTQILCLAQNIRFTEQAERAIASRELHKLKGNVDKENLYYASAEVEDENERNKRQALILQCAHYTSVIRTLIDNNVTSTADWLWQKQLRFYLLGNKDVVAKMGLAQISYSYEYLGVNTGQFVRTELADDCFLILTQALHLGLVGNPFGPAGTGKTESVKALGGLVGRLVLIFNCDEAMDSECMGRLLTGLALCGAWGCFDEFNRLSADTLAAAAVQLDSLLGATQPGAASNTAMLNGKQISVSEWCGVAATMNPVSRGYGGRRVLPPALERVLRPVAVPPPRAARVASHLLAARAVPHAVALADDMHNVYTMAGALITDSCHYDWGLRALKAGVCSAAIALAPPRTPPDATLPAQRGALRRLLAKDNMSKLTTDSALRFENILSLVFADVPMEESPPDPIKKAVEASVENLKLAHNNLQVQKCVEFYEQLQQRMGVVIVGPPGSGKTTIRRMLKNALINQGKNIVEYTICPKAMSRDWLLGNIDHDTRQWTDGVISATALEVSNQPTDVWSWVVCDGDVDPQWVEALNSVLDDNRLLTLPSGWRVQFGDNVNFVFETHSLEHASPATVSRIGVILLSEDVCCDLAYLSNWSQRKEIENETGRAAVPLLQQATTKCLQWFDTHKSDVSLKLFNITLVKQILIQFEYLTQSMAANVDKTTAEELVYLAIETTTMDIVKESAMDSLHQELSSLLGPPLPPPVTLQEWVSDSLLMSPRLVAREPALRACLAADSGHMLIVGPDACAKNILAEYVIKECNSPMITIDCTPILEPADIIAELKRNNLVRSGAQAGGGSSPRVTILIRSLHRAHVDAWGTSAVHSFLLQLIEYNGFWSRGGSAEGGAGATWSGVTRARVLATARAPVHAPRLAAVLTLVLLPEADDDELLELVKSWLQQNVDKSVQANEVIVLAGTILTMFKEVTETFHSRPQYNWNASHLKRWCENVKWYSPVNMEQLDMAITAEANAIFRDRLATDEEKSRFTNISRRYFKGNNDELYFACKLRGDGVFLEPVDYGLWHQTTEKLINQCLSEYEYNIFGDSGAEICSELAVLCNALARACNGKLSVCVGTAGVGRRAAALVTAAALSAATLFVHHPSQFNSTFKNAVASAAGGSRTLVVVSECAARSSELAHLEALHSAEHAHALPAHMRSNQLTQQELDNIKRNLGIVICLDKRQDNLPELMEKFPMLYNDAHLLWLDKWSHNTLRDMPTLVIQRLSKENMCEMTKEQLDAIPTDGFVKIHNSLDAEWQRVPCRYVHFIKGYHNIVTKKKSALLQRQTTLSAGVEALRRARSEVSKLQAEAGTQEALLSEKQAKANSALDQISATVRATTDKKEEMHALKKNIETENEKLQIQKKEIEAELASVEPVIAAARAAVGDIRPESLSEVRSLRAPPDVVRDVLEGVLRLMGIADTSWHSMKNFLSKRGVKEDIRCLDASQINPAALASVQKLVASRSTSFSAAAAKRASAACAPLAAWVRANIDYAQALQRVKPLKEHQAQLHRNLQEAEAQLTALSTGLATVDERVAALKEQLGQHTRDAAALELRLTTAADTIRTATGLLDQLACEYSAWEQDLEQIHKEISDLNQRSLLAAAYIVYLPEATEPESREYIRKWSGLIGFEDATFSVINFLSSTEKQLKWETDGLSTDLTAVKNAVLIDQVLDSPKCGLTPIVIDPDGEGLAWLKNTLADTACDFISQHSEKLLTAVQYAVRLGRILIITDVDDIHSCWSALIRALPPARLVLLSRDETISAHLPPHVARRLSPIHFTARLHPFTDQLINYALQKQNPDISEKAKEIKLQKAKLQKQQHELQENLLRELSRNGDILHDANLLASLNDTRSTSATISTALEEALTVERASEAARAQYAEPAARAAALALAVKRLNTRWPLVALPIDAALDAFVDAIKKAEDKTNVNSTEIVKYLTRRIIERVLLALHKKDKYIVVLHLLKQVYDDLMPDKLWQILIGNNEINDDALDISEIKKNHPWIPGGSLKGIAKLKAADIDLYSRLSFKNEDEWRQFISSGDIAILNKYKLSPFESLVSVAAIRPDSLYRAIVTFVDYMLGPGAVSVVSPVCTAQRAGGGRPVLLLAAHAHDALKARAPPHALTTVDVNAGPTAWNAALMSARVAGSWLALTVAGAPFSTDLQAFIANATRAEMENCNEEFRLWILSEYRDVPPLVANSCINVILEPPAGVKNNVLGTLGAWGSRAEPATTRLLACLALFHALVQERRNYIPQGWSRWYAWEWGEVSAGERAARSGAGSALVGALYAARVQTGADEAALRALRSRCLPPPHAPPAWKPPAFSAMPNATDNMQVYAAAFTALPDIDSPELLGLPANCRTAWEKNAARDILTGLKELNSTVVADTRIDSSASIKSLVALWKKYMSGSPLLKEGYRVVVGAGWWGGAARGEADEAAKVARALHAVLRVAARGGMHSLHEVPEQWHVWWAGPRSPHLYLKEFCHRAHAAIDRLQNATGSDYMPKEIDLRDFLRASRAAWALRARTAERRRVAPTTLVLTARIADGSSSASSQDEVVLRGLCVCGAACGVDGVSRTSQLAPPHAPAPPLHAKYMTQDLEDGDAPVGWLDVPVYSNESREDLLFTVRLPLARAFPRDTALLNTVALFVAPVD